MWSLTFFVKSNCRSLCCISIPICFDMICERPLKVEDAPMPSLPNQDHSWHGQGLIREGRNPKIAAHMAIECSIFGLKFHSNFQFDASRLLWRRIMKHPVESLHYSWVSTTTIVDTLWARLWCIHNPKILSWIGIGILGRYMNNFPKGTVTVYPNSVKNMQLILTWIVTWISLFYKYAKSEGPWLQNFSSYLWLRFSNELMKFE
jgi:hypothetical protein